MIIMPSKELQLKKLEDEIAHSFERGQVHWLKVAQNLWKIREGHLYPQQKFGQYSWQKWEIKERQALRLCRIWELFKEHKNCRVRQLVLEGKVSIRAAEQLADVPPEQHEEVIEEATASGKLTEPSVKKAAAKRKPKPKPDDVIEKDKIGRDIPTPAMAVWRRRKELRPQIAPLRELHQWAEDNKGTEDLLLRMIDFGKLVRDIEQVLLDINQAIPDVVCTSCQGQAELTCTFCKGRGMISISLARGCTPVEMKAIIDKTASQDDKFEKLSVAGG